MQKIISILIIALLAGFLVHEISGTDDTPATKKPQATHTTNAKTHKSDTKKNTGKESKKKSPSTSPRKPKNCGKKTTPTIFPPADYPRASSGALVAQNNRLRYSDNPQIVKRYQEMRGPRCLVDIQKCQNGTRIETGYYPCLSCHGTTICPVCNGRGSLGTSSYGTVLLCTCNYTGRCYCTVGTGPTPYASDRAFLAPLFPGWNLAFQNFYGADGRSISRQNFAREARLERKAERDDRTDRQAKCHRCKGTGYNLTPQSDTPSSQFIGKYHNGHSKCRLCGRISKHWHGKCASCMGRFPVY